jgi:metal-responsive CopG/Arc/MetJ family transcriptional regulator
MPRKVLTEQIRRLTVELPESEYQALENHCLNQQETKRQVIRALIRQLVRQPENNEMPGLPLHES